MFQHGAEEGFIVENEVAAVFIGEELDEGFRRARLRPEHAQDEINVLCGELNSTVGPDNHHTTSGNFIGCPKIGSR